MKIMTFQLAGGQYAVDLSAVSFVARSSGEVVRPEEDPVMNLSVRFGLTEETAADAPVLVLRAGAGGAARVRVDGLGDVMEIGESDVRRVPRYFSTPLVRGVVQVKDRMVVLLDSDVLAAEAAGEEPAAGERKGSA